MSAGALYHPPTDINLWGLPQHRRDQVRHPGFLVVRGTLEDAAGDEDDEEPLGGAVHFLPLQECLHILNCEELNHVT